MSGSREPSPFDDWGRWVHALAVRLGDARPDLRAFEAGNHGLQQAHDNADVFADRLLLGAWLGQSPAGWTEPVVNTLVSTLTASGLTWKAALVVEACARLGWPAPGTAPGTAPAATPGTAAAAAPGTPARPPFFSARVDAWREALAVITALGGGKTNTAAQPATTLLWRLSLDAEGRPFNLDVLEPAATARSKPKALTMLQLKRRTQLDARDAAVARCLRVPRFGREEPRLDLVAATLALVGPSRAGAGACPGAAGAPVELYEGLPLLEVLREREPAAPGAGSERECFVFRLRDKLSAKSPPELRHHHAYTDNDTRNRSAATACG